MINQIIYLFLSFLSFILSCFPRKIVLFFGKFIGFILYYIFPLRKKVAYKNLSIVYPQKKSSEINKIILKCYMHYGLLMMEFIRNAKSTVKSNLYNVDKKTIEILKNNNGLIFMTAHIGNWEMVIPLVSKYKKIMAVVREQNNKGGDKFFYKARSINNVKLISKNGSKRDMLKSLKNNYILALASDQNARNRGIFIDFFGKPASIPKGAGHFYFQTKCRIVVGFCMLNKDLNYNFNLQYIDVEKYNIEQKQDIIVKVSELYVEILEKEILKHPEQYFWFHKKWDKSIYDL